MPKCPRCGETVSWAKHCTNCGAPLPKGPVPLTPPGTDSSKPTTLFWGLKEIPDTEATKHFLICGSTGSGKSLSIRLLMQSVLPRIGRGSGMRALILDAKRDTLSVLHGMAPESELPVIRTLNPFDTRGFSWNLSKDIDSRAAARYLATLLVPPEPRSNAPYFTDAARELLRAVILSFVLTVPQNWTLRDVLLTMRTRKRIELIAGKTEETREVFELFRDDDRHFGGVLTTLATKLPKYELVAAAWHLAEKENRTVSIREDWLKEQSILILGNHPLYNDSLQPINQAIFRTITDSILSEDETTEPKHWIFLDEFRELGKLESLHALLNQGRSKGACLVLGFQDIEGLRDVYGVHVANEIVGQCNSKTFLRTGSPATAKWIEEHFGYTRAPDITQTFSAAGENVSTSENIKDKPAILASMLLSLPLTGPVHGFHAWHDVPILGNPYPTHRTWQEFWPLIKRASTFPNELRRPATDQYLVPWEPKDYKRIEIPPPDETDEPKLPGVGD